MENIHFIINPIAGSGNNDITQKSLSKYLEKENFTLHLKYSNHKKHATQLTQESITEGATTIVACGGDGTINEVASCLVGTSIALGIIPIGSGNGLASNLNIPKTIQKAIEIIKDRNITKIDVGSINNNYFFSNAGIGFDSNVIKNYENSSTRTLLCYIKASLKSFNELQKQEEIEITIDDKTKLLNPFMVFISNSNELGYKISLTPKASLKDGLLDVIIVPQISKLKILLFGTLMLIKKHHILKKTESYQTKHIKLYRNMGSIFEIQIDGEFYKIEDKTLSIGIKEKSLNVIT